MGSTYDFRGRKKGFDYAWKTWYNKYLDSRISDPQLEEFNMRMVNVSAEEEKDMTERVVEDSSIPPIRHLMSSDIKSSTLLAKKNSDIKKHELKNRQRLSDNLKGRDNMETLKEFEKEGDISLEYSPSHPGLIGKENIREGGNNTRKLKWNNPVQPLPEDITTWNSDEGKFLDNISINDKIVKASFNELADTQSTLAAVEPANCAGLLKILELCKKQQNNQPFPYTLESPQSNTFEWPLWATVLTSGSVEGQIADEVIQGVMSEVMRYNNDSAMQQGAKARGFDVQGLWDVPRFLELGDGCELPWASDIAVGISEAYDNRKMVEGGIDWNGRPPPSTRKISVLISLTDANSYEGGEFELITSETKEIKLSIGDIIMWPSFLARRIKRVTKGKLVLLQIFNNGDYFK